MHFNDTFLSDAVLENNHSFIEYFLIEIILLDALVLVRLIVRLTKYSAANLPYPVLTGYRTIIPRLTALRLAALSSQGFMNDLNGSTASMLN